MPTRLIEIVERLPASRIVLVGDVMMDQYLYGNAERLSPEDARCPCSITGERNSASAAREAWPPTSRRWARLLTP